MHVFRVNNAEVERIYEMMMVNVIDYIINSITALLTTTIQRVGKQEIIFLTFVWQPKYRSADKFRYCGSQFGTFLGNFYIQEKVACDVYRKCKWKIWNIHGFRNDKFMYLVVPITFYVAKYCLIRLLIRKMLGTIDRPSWVWRTKYIFSMQYMICSNTRFN